MPRLSFTLRDGFWLTLVVACLTAWWVEHQAGKKWFSRAMVLQRVLTEEGWTIEWVGSGATGERNPLEPTGLDYSYSHFTETERVKERTLAEEPIGQP